MRNSILTFILFFYFSCFSQPAINKNYNFKKVRSIEVLPINDFKDIVGSGKMVETSLDYNFLKLNFMATLRFQALDKATSRKPVSFEEMAEKQEEVVEVVESDEPTATDESVEKTTVFFSDLKLAGTHGKFRTEGDLVYRQSTDHFAFNSAFFLSSFSLSVRSS